MSDKYPPPPNYYTDFDADDFHLDPPVPTESATIAFEEPIMSFLYNKDYMKTFNSSEYFKVPGCIRNDFLNILNEIINFYLNILNKLSETTNLSSVDNDLNELSERFKQLIYRTNIMRQAESREMIIDQLHKEIDNKESIMKRMDASVETTQKNLEKIQQQMDEYQQSHLEMKTNEMETSSSQEESASQFCSTIQNKINEIQQLIMEYHNL